MLRTPAELPKIRVFRLTNREEVHNGHAYRDGLNEVQKFDPTGQCSEGGLYCVPATHLSEWRHFYSPGGSAQYEPGWIREVFFPEDALVWDEGDKYKCNKFILGPREPFDGAALGRFLDWASPDFCLEMVRINGLELQNVPAAIQTPKMCLMAVAQEPRALEFVHEQTPATVMMAVARCPETLRYVHTQTEEVCALAFRNSPGTVRYMQAEFQTPSRCEAYVKRWPQDFDVIVNQTPELCRMAVHGSAMSLRYVKPALRTKELCALAFRQSVRTVEFFLEQATSDQIRAGALENPDLLRFVADQDEEFCIQCVQRCGRALRHVKNQTPRVKLCAVRQNGLAIQDARDQDEASCFAAVNECRRALEFIRDEEMRRKCLASLPSLDRKCVCGTPH